MRRYFCNGLSLIELMVALTLSSGILIASFSLLQNCTNFYYKQQQDINIIENTQYARHIFNKIIHNAGYFGCHSLISTQLYNHSTNSNVTAIQAYRIENRNPILGLNHSIIDSTKLNTDILVVHYLLPLNVMLAQNMLSPNDTIQLNKAISLNNGNILSIGDCQQTDIFSINQSMKTTLLTPNITLSKAYTVNSIIGQLQTMIFYIRKNQDNQFSLYEKNGNNAAQDIIDNVNNLQVSFSTDTEPNDYFSSSSTQNWTLIKKIKINLQYIKAKNTYVTDSFIIALRNQ